MATAWCSSHGLIYYSFIKPGQSITAETCYNQLDSVIKNLAEKQPRLVNRDRPILLHDNARPHTANQTQFKIVELDLETIDHPLYSPDLSTTDYHSFQNSDNFLRGKIFNSKKAVKITFRAFIASCSPDFNDNKLPLKWQKCIDRQICFDTLHSFQNQFAVINQFSINAC